MELRVNVACGGCSYSTPFSDPSGVFLWHFQVKTLQRGDTFRYLLGEDVYK